MDRTILPPNTSAWFSLDDIRGYDVPIARRYIDFLRHGFFGGRWLGEMCCDLGVIDDGRLRLLQIMGVRHVLALTPDRKATYKRDRSGALPHVFWADHLRRSTGDVPRDLEVLRQGGMLAELPAGREPRGGRGTLQEWRVSVNAVAVHADVTEPGVLVLNEMPLRGWRVNIDGKPAAVFPVNVIQTGVRLEAGPRSVEFYFRPRGPGWAESSRCVVWRQWPCWPS